MKSVWMIPKEGAVLQAAFDKRGTMQVLPVWQLAIPLPAVFLIAIVLYMLLLGVGLWVRHCIKDRCSASCSDCCPDVSLCDQCFKMAQVCDCRPPFVRSCLHWLCPASCSKLDCAFTCQPPECDSCNCLCFEIRVH